MIVWQIIDQRSHAGADLQCEVGGRRAYEGVDVVTRRLGHARDSTRSAPGYEKT
jgi:hypothetical protein